jgi:CrcB protein
MSNSWTIWLWVALGGAAGSSLRFTISRLIAGISQARFPWATLSVNLLGCLFIGLAMGWISKNGMERWAPLMVSGFLGGFTTFSAFGWESYQMLREEAIGSMLIYIGLSIVLGILFVMMGYKWMNA